MPKELIRSCFYEENQAAEHPLPGFSAQVTWGRNAYVQIATVNEEAPLGSVESGLYVDLDRKGINDLIRVLRRARDQAYGRDE